MNSPEDLDSSRKIIDEIRKRVGEVCKKNGFIRNKGGYWSRVRNDAIHAIRIDRRVVGKYPYFVEVGIDFFSAGATAGQPFNRFSVAFRIERAMKAPDEFLGALAPKMPFGTTERRCEVVEEELQKKISEDIDTVHDLTSFKILRERYSDENTLTITLRVRNLL